VKLPIASVTADNFMQHVKLKWTEECHCQC